jgi:proteasome lid subunit RPN8/RPN11
MESHTASDSAVWSVSQSLVTVEYSLRTLDEIRLAVVDAFFSVPRGGAEIGGILLGKHTGNKVAILDYRPFDCEHANGPSFTLSPNDHSALRDMLVAIWAEGPGLSPVGWYHSHTRSEIVLSDADLEIHNRYFPESWQVALVLKPHTFQPMRAGFFVREKEGKIHATASRREFVLEPWAGSPALVTDVEVAVPIAATATAPAAAKAPAQADLDLAEEEAGASEESAEPSEQGDHYLPRFARVAEVAPAEPSRGWLPIIVAILAGLALGAGAYQSRQFWVTPLMGWITRITAASTEPGNPAPPYLGLRCLDTDGQLWIFWDRNAPSVHAATSGTLIIHDGGQSHSINLDQPHLQAGSFTYGREGEKVDLTLTVVDGNGQSTREVSTYLGKLPTRLTPVEPPPQQPVKGTADRRVSKNQKARR